MAGDLNELSLASDVDFNDDESLTSSDDIISISQFSMRTRESSLCSVERPPIEDGNYLYENNRRYDRFGNWMVPNDEQEYDRMDIFHQLITTLLNGELHRSPLISPRRILDVGTGTGVWAVEMAFKYPNARVIGTDISGGIQAAGPPPNCSFQVQDAERDWQVANYYDMVHTRQLIGGISDWPRFFEQAFTALRPGGWLELHETPGRIHSANPNCPPDLPIIRAVKLLCDAGLVTGYRFDIEEVNRFKTYMAQCGFVDIQETRLQMPIGTWPSDPIAKHVGRLNTLNFLEGLTSYILAPCSRILGMSNEQVSQLATECRSDFLRKKNMIYHEFLLLRGRKP